MTRDRPLPFGGKIGRYKLVSRIGKGGMGIVYRARDETLERDVALKMIPLGEELGPVEQTERIARFLREARACANLRHPGIIELHDVGEHEGIPFAVLELVAGATLREMTDAGARLPPEQKLRYLLEIAKILDFAHARGFIHRDIKPENVMITPRGEVKLLDFGLAKRQHGIAPPSGNFQTAEGRVVGTPGFMAPEQRAGTEVDARADQYGWGALAYELLTGKFVDPIALRPPMLEPNEEVKQAVCDVVNRTLTFEPSTRFPSMGDVAAALEPAVAVRPPQSQTAKIAIPRSRSGGTVLLVGVGLCILAASLATILLVRSRGARGARADTTSSASESPPRPSAITSTSAGAPPSSSASAAASTSVTTATGSCACKDSAGVALCPDAARVPTACRCETKKKAPLCPQPWSGAACTDAGAAAGFYFPPEAIGSTCTGFRRGVPGKASKFAGVIAGCSSCGPNAATYDGETGGACEGASPEGPLTRGVLDCARSK